MVMIKLLVICTLMIVSLSCAVVEDKVNELQTDVAESYPTAGKVIEEVKTDVAEGIETVEAGREDSDPDSSDESDPPSEPDLPDRGLPFLYMATGDSVPYGQDMPRRSPYGRVLFERLRTIYSDASWENISVSGDTTAQYLRTQLPQVIDRQPSLVTVTIGADDMLVRLADELAEVALDLQCGLDEQLTRQNLNVILFNLVERTDATVAITTYYNPFGGTAGELVQGCIDVLNSFIIASADAVNARYPNRVAVVDISDLFAGHGWLAATRDTGSSWIQECGDLFFCVHPNLAGQAAIANTIARRLGLE